MTIIRYHIRPELNKFSTHYVGGITAGGVAAGLGAAGSIAGAATSGKGGGEGQTRQMPEVPPWLASLLRGSTGQSENLFNIQRKGGGFTGLELRGQQDILRQLAGVKRDVRNFSKIPGQFSKLSNSLGRTAEDINEVGDTFGASLFPFLSADIDSPINAAYREANIAPIRREFLESILPRLGVNEAMLGNIGSSKGTLEEIGAGERYLQQVGDISARSNAESLNRTLQAIGMLPTQANIFGQEANVLGMRANILGQRGNLLQQLSQFRQLPGQIKLGIGQQRFQRPNDILDNLIRRLTGVSSPFIGSNTSMTSGGGNISPIAGALGGGIGGLTLGNELAKLFGNRMDFSKSFDGLGWFT